MSMKAGTCSITIPFSHDVEGIHYEYQVTKLDGKTPTNINFGVNKNNQIVVRGAKRLSESGFVFEVSVITDEERDMIYAQVTSDLNEILTLAESINLNTPE